MNDELTVDLDLSIFGEMDAEERAFGDALLDLAAEADARDAEVAELVFDLDIEV